MEYTQHINININMFSRSTYNVSSHVSKYVVRIATLPSQLVNLRDVRRYVENEMLMGDVSTVFIKKHTNNKTRACFRSAVIGLENMNDTFYHQFLHNGDNGIDYRLNPVLEPFVADNGMPLYYLKMYMTENTPLPTMSTETPLQLKDDDWKSIYIPHIPELLLNNEGIPRSAISTEDDMIRIFEEELKFGKVSRVDFVPFDVKPANRVVPHRSAYIHFDHWYDNLRTRTIRSKIESQGAFRYSEYYDENGYHKAFRNDGYLLFKINHAPIPVADGTYNIHQLADIKFKLEKQNMELREELAKVRGELEEMKSAMKTDK